MQPNNKYKNYCPFPRYICDVDYCEAPKRRPEFFFNFSHYAVTILFTTLTSTFHNLDYKPSLGLFIIRVSVDFAYIHKILVFFSFCYLLKYVCGCGLQ